MSLYATATALVAPGKGILAADESHPTMAKRLARIGLDSTEAVRRDYRELLLGTPGLDEHVSGVILFDETVRQTWRSGTPVPAALLDRGIIPGVKVDAGLTPLPRFPDEDVTQGLDHLYERLAEYVTLGARFAKWRGVIRIGAGRPTAACIEANAHALARYAAAAQEQGLVPVVEPEVLMDGNHSLEQCAAVTTVVLRTVYDHLARYRVDLSGTLLKPNMVLPGTTSGQQVDDEDIAAATLGVLRDTVPVSVPGIVFLSGGQTPEQATARLDALNRAPAQPWQLSFSFGRALQAPVLDTWAGLEENRGAARSALLHRARMNGLARRGRWAADLEPHAAA
ncbi:fructose-bisphosphate aldolase [Nocardioides sp. Root122]|uniref:class I fructose-bisphosphate aldolase n=1 Tax=Nocardioides TaxID=1839 RepID=UPI0007025034|nr:MULTISPECIES: class I fructose-bisphosphate aldolase [Nocardioides]KQV69578.1 fructose-bisphosphate aldolase [Nocardioides sp. Root122]MCK9824495.1 fructose-bisphosphate aldolase class I [Nocardioides cavernae]